MKKLVILFSLFVSFSVFSQNTTWYLESFYYKDEDQLEFNENIPDITAYFDYDDEWNLIFESQACGHLKLYLMEFLCGCEMFSIVEILEYDNQSCEIPQSTQFQDNYFDFFLDDRGESVVIFHYGVETLADGTHKLGISRDHYIEYEYESQSFITFIDRNLSTSDAQLSQVTLYPNPVKNELFFSQEIKELEVYNLVGKRVISAKNTKTLDFSSLLKGTYLIRATLSDNSNRTFKILKN